MKLIGLVLAGVFVGVIIRELIGKKNPDALSGVGRKAADLVTSFKSAFNDGYSQTAAENV